MAPDGRVGRHPNLVRVPWHPGVAPVRTASGRQPVGPGFAYVVPMIRYRVDDGGVAHLVLDRPEAKNALSIEMRDEIVARVREVRSDPAVRALLVTGVGDAFCAGMDLRASTVSRAGGEGFDPRATSEALRVGVQAFIRELWELDKPTVAAVNGTAVGPGAHLALACDFVLVCEQTRFVWSFAKWGLVVDAGGAYLLPRLVGLPRAKAMVLLGEGARWRGGRGHRTGLPLRGRPGRAGRGGVGPGGAAGRRPDPVARAVQAAPQFDLRERSGRVARPRGPGPGDGDRLARDGRGDGGLR